MDTHPLHLHGRGQSRSRRPLRRLLLIGVLTAVLGVAGTGYYFYRHLSNNISSIDIDRMLGANRPPNPDDGSQDILVLGSDARTGANGNLAGGNTGSTARSDTAMVVHLYQGNTKAAVVSIPRDTLVTRPACPTSSGGSLPEGHRVMFNSVFSQGGAACTVRTVENLTGIRMDHYAEVDFVGFTKLVEALGGVSITLDQAIHDRHSGLSLEAGTHRLDGTQALAFVRTRHGIGDGSDLGRIGLQQKFLLSALTQIKQSDLLTHPTRLYHVADTATRALTTDTRLSSLASLGQLLRRLGNSGMETIVLPVVPDAQDPNRVVTVDSQATRLWQALKSDQPLPDLD